MKKSIFKGLAVLSCLSLCFVSCDDKDDNLNKEIQQVSVKKRLKQVAKLAADGGTETPSTSDEDFASDCIASFDCFEYVYPLKFKDQDDNEKAVNNEEELYAFYQSLPQDFSPEQIYPITIKYEDGKEQIVATEAELDTAYDTCFGADVCFDFDFPITLSDEKGNETVVSSETELNSFYNNLSEDTSPEFVFPITIILAEDDSKITINSDEDFDAIYGKCYGFEDYDDFESFDCFELQFPITVESATGGEISLNSEEDIEEYFSNLEEDEEPMIKFPITILYMDGTNKEISSLEELERSFDSCFVNDDDSDICFDITYPINLQKNEDETNVTVNSDEEFDTFLDSLGEEDYFDLAYPVNMLLEDGSTKVINNDDEFIGLVESCE